MSVDDEMVKGKETQPLLHSKDGKQSSQWPRYLSLSFLVLVGADILDAADSKAMPAILKAVETSMHMTPKTLGKVEVIKTLLAVCSSPFWAHLADGSHRRVLIAGACTLFGLTTMACGLADSAMTLSFLVVINGIALCSMKPISTSVVADITVPKERGRAFGLMKSFAHFGEFFSILLVAPLSQMFFHGIAGWRLAFIVLGVLSVLYGSVVARIFQDPRRRDSSKHHAITFSPEKFTKSFKTIVQCKTWALVCFQGMFGSIPYSALHFLVMWLQYQGFSPTVAGTLAACVTAGTMGGTLVAGMVGDKASVVSPDYGRVVVATLADMLRPGLLFVLLVTLPSHGFSADFYTLVLFSLGFLMPWPSVACGLPIFTEIVPADARASCVAYQMIMERSIGAFGAFAVGYIAEVHFGYNTQAGFQQFEDMITADRLQNATALRNAMLFTAVVPWTICALLYPLVALTYKHDRDRVSLAEQELQHGEL